MISHQSGINARIDGVLGLSRSIMGFDDIDESTRDIGPLLVNQLAENGVINQNLFSFHLVSEDSNNSVSFVDFGPIQENHMKIPTDMTWIDVYDHMFWMTYQTYGIRFGESDEDAFTFDPKQNFLTVFDSGTSTVYVPFSLWSNFIA